MPFFPRQRSRNEARRREDDGLSALAFELESLEFVAASDDIGLMRVGGRFTAPVSRALDGIALVVARGTETLQLTPLPDLNGVAPLATPAGEEWWGAFTMTVEIAEDPRVELVLLVGDEVRVDLPRPGEWQAAQTPTTEPEHGYEAESESPIVAELVARLDEVARMEHEEAGPEPAIAEPSALEPGHEPAPEPALAVEPLGAETPPDSELISLRAEVELLRIQLEEARTELELERRRRAVVDEELRARGSVEEDLRNAIATQEAELASAAQLASQNAMRAERRRDLSPPPAAAAGEAQYPRSHPADEEFLARLERARRASETVA